jgi:hypothetical protein
MKMTDDIKELLKKQAETEVALAANKKDLASVQANRAEYEAEMAELEKKIEESKKPQPRLGDYGMCYRNRRWWVVLDAEDPKKVIVGVEREGVEIEEWNGGFSEATCYGNIGDDLKAMQEDVTEFKVTYPNDNAYMRAWFDDDMDVRLDIACDYLDAKRLSEFILKLRQMEATLRRQKGE